jgi:hypothetical protein
MGGHRPGRGQPDVVDGIRSDALGDHVVAPTDRVLRPREIPVLDPFGEALDDRSPAFGGGPVEAALDPGLASVEFEGLDDVDLGLTH